MTDTVTISRAEYQALLQAKEDLEDIRDANRVMGMISSGEMASIPGAEGDARLAAATPLAFRRRKRAEAAGISQPFVAQMETGQRVGDVSTLAKLPGVSIEDLLMDAA